jgi:hypothetical protein
MDTVGKEVSGNPILNGEKKKGSQFRGQVGKWENGTGRIWISAFSVPGKHP